ncbi:hypothetical protein ACVODM_24190, partial [Shigella flexneri]
MPFYFRKECPLNSGYLTPHVAELGDDSGWHFFSQRNPDNSIVFTVNGQVIPLNYGNFDARYKYR